MTTLVSKTSQLDLYISQLVQFLELFYKFN